MGKRLYCRVRVVLSITLVTWLAGSFSLHAQNSVSAAKITFVCESLCLEKVLEKIAQRSGASFIYSSSLLDINKKVSISVDNQSLSKVLDRIGNELNLSFRYEGKYIIIKKSELIAQRPEIKINSSSLLASPVASTQTMIVSEPRYVSIQSSFPQFSTVSVRIHQLTPMKPLELIAPKGLIQKHGFASIGLISNEYALGGMEMRGGLKQLFGVVNFGMVEDDRYRVGFGGGVATVLTSKLSVNVIYNHAGIYGNNDIRVVKELDHFISEKNYHITMNHNQLKVLLQYDIHPKLYVNAGASFNLLNTNYKWQKTFQLPAENSSYMKPVNGFGGVTSISEETHSFTPLAPPSLNASYQTTRTWIGWELGIFYRINF
jgi:hypothetical protein